MLFDRAIHSFEDARRIARRRLPWMVFDYIDGAAGEGGGAAANREAMRSIWLRPRILNDVRVRKIGAEVFGEETDLPFGVAPMGMCNLASPHADRWLAKLGAERRIPVGVSTVASTSLEEMAKRSDGRAWFQLYISGDGEGSYPLMDRAAAAGYRTLVITVDVPEVGRRPRELRRGFKMPFRIGPSQFIDFAAHPFWSIPQLLHGKPEMGNFGGAFGAFDRTETRASATWEMLARMRDRWKGNLVVKGVLDPEDAVRLKGAGVDGVQVSSHGARQLESGVPPILALGAIREAVGPDMPLFYDSGLRSGEDIVKAYAMGADFVFLGRPFSFAIAAGGEAGLSQMAGVLADEVSIALAQLALTDVRDLGPDAICGPADF